METIKLNITQLNSIIKRIIDAEEFLQTISVYGEVSNFKISAGNAYFDIKEQGAQLSCIKFGATEDIHNGDMVLLTGRLNYYVKTGRLSFIANKIEPYGLGELYKQFLMLKEKLSAEGLFDESIKKELPRYANKVGVITSETGAVIRDIVHVAKKKNPYTDIIVYPSRVQGDGAEKEVIAGLKYFDNTDVDVVIIARGGGSFEDLAPFNTEALARAIFACHKPVISAVGHETDFSISDFAADMRAPTPSVAGELAFFDFSIALQKLNSAVDNIYLATSSLIESRMANIDSVSNKIAASVQNIVDINLLTMKNVAGEIINKFQLNMTKRQSILDNLATKIEKSNPMNILKSGYSIVESGGKKITSTNQIDLGDEISVTFADGKVNAKITKKGERVWHTKKHLKN